MSGIVAYPSEYIDMRSAWLAANYISDSEDESDEEDESESEEEDESESEEEDSDVEMKK